MTKYLLSLAIIVFSVINLSAGELTATIKTEKGDIVLELYGSKAPVTVASFVNLANRGFYDGLNFHRVINDFMVQGGCPNGNGMGNPGYKFEDEFPTRDIEVPDPKKPGKTKIVKELIYKHTGPGILSMANSGPGTNGSQFFITHVKTDWLDGKHTVFGKVLKGQDVVNKIRQKDKVISITISGGIPKQVKAVQNRVDEWNKILDARYKHLKPAKNL